MIFGKISAVDIREDQHSPDTSLPTIPVEREKIADWYIPSLTLTVLLAACLNFWQLGQYGYSNLYYAAGTRSMLSSQHAFFFAAFDPKGFVSIDKPPVDFWIQVASAKLLGFSPFSVLLPQALAGVLSVILLAHLVRRNFGALAGLLAALALTLTPISVITSRTNDVDSMLVLTSLLAAWVVIIAAERGSLRWLLLSMVLVGIGFNIKMAEAYLVVPAFVLLYFLTAQRRWLTKSLHLVLAIIVLVAISLSWSIAVDLTPLSQRPYVGSSGANSELKLVFGYNGIGRLTGLPSPHPQNKTLIPQHLPHTHRLTPPSTAKKGAMPPSLSKIATPSPLSKVTISPSAPSNGGMDGFPGPGRLFNFQLAGQISWLLPLAVMGLLLLLWRLHNPRLRKDKQLRGLVLWGTWFSLVGIFFSMTSGFQIYYMVMFAPAICALVGIGIATLWHDYINRKIRGFLLPVAFLITAITQLYFLSQFPAWRNSNLPTTIVAVISFVVLGLFTLRLLKRDNFYSLSSFITTIGLLVLLLAPALWTAIPVIQNRNSGFPLAGPYDTTLPSLTQTQMLTTDVTLTDQSKHNKLSATDLLLLHFLETHEKAGSYIYATTTFNYAALTIIETGKAVMTMGGFAGNDTILTLPEFINLIHTGIVRYILLPATTPPMLQDITDWIKTSCTHIHPYTWYSKRGAIPQDSQIAGLILYDCATPRQPTNRNHPHHLQHQIHSTPYNKPGKNTLLRHSGGKYVTISVL